MQQTQDRLSPIRSEKDLEAYRRFLERDGGTAKAPDSPPTDFLRAQLGKNVRVHLLFGGRMIVKSGQLTDADADFLVLRRCDGSLTACAAKSVQFITVLPQRQNRR